MISAHPLTHTRECPFDLEDSIDLDRQDIYQPTPEEIRAVCREIQAEWSEAERARRARGQAGRQRTPVVSPRRFAKITLENNVSDGRAA